MFIAMLCALWLVGCRQSVSPEAGLKTTEDGPAIAPESPGAESPDEETEAAAAAPDDLTIKETAYFTIMLPTNWTIEEQATEEGDTDASFEVQDPEGNEVFVVTVATDEPRFIQCFCAPWEYYKKYDKDGIKYADLTMNVGRASVRTLKAVGAKYGTDVHLDYENYDRKLLDSVVESIRPL